MKHIEISTKPGRQIAGFTLVETVIAIAVLSLLVFGALVFMPRTKSKASLIEAQAFLINALEEARSAAINGGGGVAHGLHIEPDRFIEFAGSNYIPGAGEVTFLPPLVDTDQASTTMVFSRITGFSNVSGTITLVSSDGATKKVSVTYDGAILRQ